MKEQNRIPKLILMPGQIDSFRSIGDLTTNDSLVNCYECNGNLFYVEKVFGVVAEEYDYGVVGNKNNRVYRLTEVGLALHCSECGDLYEHYSKWFFPEDKLVLYYTDLEDEGPEYKEINYCLSQYNQKGDFTPEYKCSEVNILKTKLDEYEKAHPIKEEKKEVKKK